MNEMLNVLKESESKGSGWVGCYSTDLSFLDLSWTLVNHSIYQATVCKFL